LRASLCTDLYINGFILSTLLGFWLVRRLGGPWLHLRSSAEWVARCWDGLLPAGRNVRVGMMVECFGIYRVSQEECVRLREGVPYAKVYRYNPKHLCPKLNGYGHNGQ